MKQQSKYEDKENSEAHVRVSLTLYSVFRLGWSTWLSTRIYI